VNLTETVRRLFGSEAVGPSNHNWEALMAEHVRLLQTNGYDSEKPKRAPLEHARCPDDIQ
jgi:hypothetical protein